MKTKQCTTCGELKELNKDNFILTTQRGKPYWRPVCRPCNTKRQREQRWAKNGKPKPKRTKEEKRAYDLEYQANNKECIKAQRRQFYLENKERLNAENRAYHKTYWENNKEKVLERRRAKNKERRKIDPVFRLKGIVSTAIYRAVKGIKDSRTFDALPYTPEQLREHLESQFEDWMTWDNYGSHWHIDHIYPQSKLPYDSMEHPNFLLCWSLDNLRPLEKIENIKKSNKILDNHPQIDYIIDTTTNTGDKNE